MASELGPPTELMCLPFEVEKEEAQQPNVLVRAVTY